MYRVPALLSLLLFPPSLLAAGTEAKAAERAAGVPIDGGSLVNTALGLVLVLIIIFGLAWLVRRFGHLPTANRGLVSILGGVSLGPRERAVLLRVGETHLLVGVAPGRVQTLHVLGTEEPAAPTEEANGETPFADRLKDAVEERG